MGEEEGSAEEKARQRTSLRGFSKETPTPHKSGAAVRRPEDPQSFLMPPWEPSPPQHTLGKLRPERGRNLPVSLTFGG